MRRERKGDLLSEGGTRVVNGRCRNGPPTPLGANSMYILQVYEDRKRSKIAKIALDVDQKILENRHKMHLWIFLKLCGTDGR